MGAFLDGEAERNPSSSESKPTVPSMSMPPEENLQLSSQAASPPVKKTEDPLSSDAQPLPSRVDGSEKARKIILQKLYEAGNGDLTLVARVKEDGKQELVGRQGLSFSQHGTEASRQISQHPEPTPSSSSSQSKQNLALQSEVDVALNSGETKIVGRMHYGAVKSNKSNGNGGTRLNITEEDDERYMRQRKEQKNAAHAAMLRKQQELEQAAPLKPKVPVNISEAVANDEDINEDDDSTLLDEISPSGITMPPPPPSESEVQQVMDSNRSDSDDDGDDNDNAIPSISGIGRSRRDKGSSAMNRKERMKQSFRKLENKRKGTEGEQ